LDNRPHANITTTQPEGKSGEDSYGNSSLFTSKFLPIINIKQKSTGSTSYDKPGL
jgi:hypothetical protein